MLKTYAVPNLCFFQVMELSLRMHSNIIIYR
jgi:hypothetical protein